MPLRAAFVNVFRFLPVLAALLLSSTAPAVTVDVDAALADVSNAACRWLIDIERSLFVAVIAVVMFSAGAFMLWLRIRGGLGMIASGLIGYFLHSNTVEIARSFGLNGCG